MTPNNPTQLKEETLRWIFSIAGALLVYFLATTIAQHLYHPDLALLQNTARQLLVEPSAARPEPMEAFLFRLAVVTIIPSLLGLYLLFSKTRAVTILAREPVYLGISIVAIASIVVLTYFDFAALNPYGPEGGDIAQNKRDAVSITNFGFYFDSLFMGDYLWIYTLVFVPLVAYLFFAGFKKNNWQDKPSFKSATSIAGYLVLGGTILAIGVMHTFRFPYSNDNKFDFNAVYYAMTQVYAGSPLLVDGFTDAYGLYPHFLNPLFQVIGLNVLKFSLVMSVLVVTCFTLNFYFLKKFVSNNIILFLGFATVLFFPYLDFKFATEFDCIFSYYPIRYIIPSVITFLAAGYLIKPSVKLYWGISVLTASFILWNPEMGLVCYIAWIATNMYKDTYTPEGQFAIKKILLHLVYGIGVAVAVFYLYKLLIWLFYGAAPDMQLLFGTISVFSKIGFNLLPMSLVHPWNLMALILIPGFTYAIVKGCRKEITPKACIILLVSVISLGYFAYFQGRSQNTNFAVSTGFCIMLLILLGDELWMVVKNTNILLLNAVFIIFLYFISFSFIELLYGAGKMKELAYQDGDRAEQEKAQETMESNIDFIVQQTQEKEKILILTQKKNQALLFDGNKRVSAFNPGFIDLLLQTDVARLDDILMDSSFSVFLEPSTKSYPYMTRPTAALAATYEYKSVNRTMVMLGKRKMKLPSKSFFTEGDSPVFHRKYTDNPQATRQRVNDADGISPVATGPEFSISLLFYSAPQMFPDATIVSNIKDSAGFAIANVFNSSKLLFLVNTTALSTTLKYNEWEYCVMNVYTDHAELYKNGVLVSSTPLPRPARPSERKLSIGNMGVPGEFNYYIGGISEIAIHNKVWSKETVEARWREINQTIQ